MSVFKKALAEEPEESLTMTKSSKHSHINHMYDKLHHQSTQKIFDTSTKALLEDPNNLDPFGYDSYYDQISSQRKANESLKKQDKSKPKYINSLIDAAEKRKRERSIVYEKLAENELKKEGSDNKGERFITESYRKVLEENKKFLKEDEEKEKFNDKHGISGKQDLSAIYHTMFRDSAFHGGDRGEDLEKQKKIDEMMKITLEKKQEEALKIDQKNKEKEQQKNRSSSKNKEKEKRREKDRSRSRSRDNHRRRERDNREKSRSKNREKDREHHRRDKHRENDNKNKEREKSQQKTTTNDMPPPPSVISKDDKLASARERYLSRKMNPQPIVLEEPNNL